MNVFVVLATHQREKLLARTLASLAACRLPDGFRGTFIVENGERGGSEKVVRQAAGLLRAEYLFEPFANKSRALNAALRGLEDGFIVFLDDDVRLTPDTLELHAAAARKAGQGHVFGGPVAAEYEEEPPAWLEEFLPPSARGWNLEAAEKPIKTLLFLGCNWGAFTQDLRRVGGFNEDFGPGSLTGSVGQETEMQRRLQAAGVVPTYVPGALVHHWVPRGRCSPAFALERAYRDGIRAGLLRQDELGPLFCGYPVALLKRMLGTWLRLQVQRFSATRAERFATQVVHRRKMGVIKGVMRSRQRPGGAPSATLHRHQE